MPLRRWAWCAQSVVADNADNDEQLAVEGIERQAESDPRPWNKPARKLMQSNVEKLSETLWADTPWDVKL